MRIIELSHRLFDNQIELEVDDTVYEFLVAKSSESSGFGARPLNRLIVSEVENKIADMIVKEEIISGDKIRICIVDNAIACIKVCLAIK